MKYNIKLLEEYYKKNGITEYPKTKKGMPNMRCNFNKKHYKNIKSESKKCIDEYKTLNKCVICYETITNSYCKLDCEHVFCTDCIIQHGRINNNCPLCRNPISKSNVKNIEKINSVILQEIYNNEILYNKNFNIINEDDDNIKFTFYEFLNCELNDFEKIVSNDHEGVENEKLIEEYKDCMIQNIRLNTYKLINSISGSIIGFYDNQL
jgi:hypothetical protein